MAAVRLALEPREVALQRWLEAIPATLMFFRELLDKADAEAEMPMQALGNMAAEEAEGQQRRLAPIRFSTVVVQCLQQREVVAAVGLT